MDSPELPYELVVSNSSLELALESTQHRQDKEWIISVKDAAFPPDHMAWLKEYERPPNSPLRQTYRNGILQSHVDTSAPTIKIGIIFAEGRDKPAVAKAEINRRSSDEPDQMTPEWRVGTAATLLRRFDVDDELQIRLPDDSTEILQRHKQRTIMKPFSNLSRSETASSYRRGSKGSTEPERYGAIIPRNIQDQILTVDSDAVKILHPNAPLNEDFDITSTLIEVDLISLTDLMSNYRQIIWGSGRNVSAAEILKILDQMINDVRRLCTRSPRLFRMSTRSLIAQSDDTRYGVNYGTVFATMITSDGIRRLVEKSASYYLSLNDSKSDQGAIRPIFLQMLVLLLSFLNNRDLARVKDLLEGTFQVPGDRSELELVIMKVLPLGSIDSQVFLEALYNTYKPYETMQGDYKSTLQPAIWDKLQRELAQKGYLLPILADDFGSVGSKLQDCDFDDDLEDALNAELKGMSVDRSAPADTHPSWFPPWPEKDGFMDSTVFRFLQHHAFKKKGGSKTEDTFRALNDVPHLEVTSEDNRYELLATFANGTQYRIANSDPDLISQMEKNQYVLKAVNEDSIASLVIDEDTLNKPLIDATRRLNYLVDKVQSLAGTVGQKRTKVFSSNKTSLLLLALLNEPAEAKRVRANITLSSGEVEPCAEAYKLGNRVVFREDVLRDMNTSLTKLEGVVARIDQELPKYHKKIVDEHSMRHEHYVRDLSTKLDIIKNLMEEAKTKRQELQNVRQTLSSDPITKVIYPSLAHVTGGAVEFEKYQSQLSKDERRLIIQSRTLTVGNIPEYAQRPIKLDFDESLISMWVEPLVSAPSANDPSKLPVIVAGDTFLWLGYYLLLVHVVDKAQRSYRAVAYFRILSQAQGRDSRGMKPAPHKPQMVSLI